MVRVMIVEDEALFALALKKNLVNLGYDVTNIAVSGEDAVQLADKHRPDLVLMDIVLQGEMDGVTAAEIIRTEYNIPSIFVTAYVDDDLIARAKNADPLGYLVKPVQKKELKAVIELAVTTAAKAVRRKQIKKELLDKTAALKAFNQSLLGREERVIELKEEVDRLRAELGKDALFGLPSRTTDESADGTPGLPKPETGSARTERPVDSRQPSGWHAWHNWAAAIVLLASLSMTGVTWHFVNSEHTQRTRERFDVKIMKLENALKDRLLAYEHLLRGGAGLFAASKEVTRHDWHSYVDHLEIEKTYPGIQGMGFSKWIPPSEKEVHVDRIRKQGFPEYTIRPGGDRPVYTSIIYLEPFDWRNQRAFGYDMFSEPVRKTAMTRARDTGKPAMTGKVSLVQETHMGVQAGFLIYVPVYRNDVPIETIEHRRNAIEGVVYSPFRMNNFIDGVLAGLSAPGGAYALAFQIFDGEKISKETLMYQSTDTVGIITKDPHRLTHRAVFSFAGHRWLILFASSPQFEAEMTSQKADYLLWSGVVVSLLLSILVLAFHRSYRQAKTMAVLGIESEASNRRLTAEMTLREQSEAALKQRLAEIQSANRVMIDREQRVIALKEEVNHLCTELGRNVTYPPVWRAGDTESVDRTLSSMEGERS